MKKDLKITEKPAIAISGGYRLAKFVNTFRNGKTIFLEDSVLWHALQMGVDFYLKLSIHERFNFKQSYFQ